MKCSISRLLSSFFIGLLSLSLTGCLAGKVPSTTDSGTVVNVKNGYSTVYLMSEKGIADYEVMLPVKFRMKVYKNDPIMIVPVRYIDSLINETKEPW